MSTTTEVGDQLVSLCQQGKNHDAIDTLYADDIVSVEAGAMPGHSAEIRGKAAVLAKSVAWGNDHTVHGAKIAGPFPHGDSFIVHFEMDVTHKPTNSRRQLNEMALYKVANDKIVHEAFFYRMG